MFSYCGQAKSFPQKLFNIFLENVLFRWRFVEDNWPVSSQSVALLVIFLVVWGIFSSLFPGLVYANSTLMRIVFLVIGAQICGILVTFIGLPGEKTLEFTQIWFLRNHWASDFNNLSMFYADMLGMIGFGGEYIQIYQTLMTDNLKTGRFKFDKFFYCWSQD